MSIEKVERWQNNLVGILSSTFLAIFISLGNVLAHLGLVELEVIHPHEYRHPAEYVNDLVANISGSALAPANEAYKLVRDVPNGNSMLAASGLILLTLPIFGAVAFRFWKKGRSRQAKRELGYSVLPGS